MMFQSLIASMEYGENAAASTEAVSIGGDLHLGLGDRVTPNRIEAGPAKAPRQPPGGYSHCAFSTLLARALIDKSTSAKVCYQDSILTEPQPAGTVLERRRIS
jgi:hypothetical protein